MTASARNEQIDPTTAPVVLERQGHKRPFLVLDAMFDDDEVLSTKLGLLADLTANPWVHIDWEQGTFCVGDRDEFHTQMRATVSSLLSAAYDGLICHEVLIVDRTGDRTAVADRSVHPIITVEDVDVFLTIPPSWRQVGARTVLGTGYDKTTGQVTTVAIGADENTLVVTTHQKS